MQILKITSCLVFIMLCSPLFFSQLLVTDSLVVTTKYGKLKGVSENGSCVWKGIQYAKAPIGNLRFKKPSEVDVWEGIKSAIVFGPIAPQSAFKSLKTKYSEDCLTLNVWSPKADIKKRPVMFWIHGGAFANGSGSTPIYNGANLSQKGNVVVVTINYRLGPLGFLYFDSLATKNNEFDSNLGIKDQIFALQWVRDNIEKFGGDPNNVTIFGQSAGATSVITLLACPAAKGLFNKAIAESPALNFWTKQEALEVTKKYLKALGITPATMANLYALSPDSLINVSKRMLNDRANMPGLGIFSPVIDGEFIPEKPTDAVAKGCAKNIPLLIGTNKNEVNLFKSFGEAPVPLNSKQLHQAFLKQAPLEEQRITTAYHKNPSKKTVLALVTDGVFNIPSIRLAESHSVNAPTWMYRFNWESLPLMIVGLKTFHALETFFVFGTFDEELGKKVTTLTIKQNVTKVCNTIQTAWTNFAYTGNPNGNSKISIWEMYNTKERATLMIGKKTKLTFDPKAKYRAAWGDVNFFSAK